MINSVANTSLYGIQQGYNRVDTAAQSIAEMGSKNSSNGNLDEVMLESAMELQRGKLQVQASTQALEAAEKTVGSIIDITV